MGSQRGVSRCPELSGIPTPCPRLCAGHCLSKTGTAASPGEPSPLGPRGAPHRSQAFPKDNQRLLRFAWDELRGLRVGLGGAGGHALQQGRREGSNRTQGCSALGWPGMIVHSPFFQTHQFSGGREIQTSATGEPWAGVGQHPPAGLSAGNGCPASHEACQLPGREVREGSLAALHGPRMQERQRQLVPGQAGDSTAWPRSPSINGAGRGHLLHAERFRGPRRLESSAAGLTRLVLRSQGARLGAGVSCKDLEELCFTEMEIFIFLISILAVSKLEKEVWKASLPLRQDSKAYISSDGYC